MILHSIPIAGPSININKIINNIVWKSNKALCGCERDKERKRDQQTDKERQRKREVKR